MPETLSTTSGPKGGYEQVRYDNGSIHIYENQPQPDGTTKKIHVKTDDMIRGFGYEPGPVPDEPEKPSRSPEDDPLSAINKRFDDLERRQEEAEQNAERRHQELLAAINNLADAIRGGRGPNDDPSLPPGSRVGPPEDPGMGRMREHFSMLDGDDEEEQGEPREPSPAEKLAQAEQAMAAARDELVIYTIRRRARSGDGLTANRREDKESYDAAMAKYLEAKQAYLRAYGEQLDLGDPEHPENALTEQQIQSLLFKANHEETLKFKEAEFKKNNELLDQEVEAGGWRKFKANVLRKWANYSTKKKLLIGLGVGGAAALASGTLGLGLAAIAAGSAVKFSLGLLSRSASARNISQKSFERETARLEREFEKSLLEFDREADAAAQHHLTLGRESMMRDRLDATESTLDRAVSRAQWRNRLGNALLIAGAGSAIYGIAHLAGDHLPDFRLWPNGGPAVPGPEHHVTPIWEGVHANTIHAQTPMEFQHGVVKLLENQGIKVHANNEQLMQMTHWMDTHHIASGMERAANGGLEQHITAFPRPGEHFSNYLASAEQGFKIGNNGNGDQALHEWMRHAQSIGIGLERINK